MLNKIKNFFYDEQTGIKWLPAIGTIGGAIAGGMLEVAAPLGLGAIPAGAALGAALGGGLEHIKSSRSAAHAPTHASPAAHAHTHEKAPGHGKGIDQGLHQPEVPKGIPAPGPSGPQIGG
jgi:hypothetical protein